MLFIFWGEPVLLYHSLTVKFFDKPRAIKYPIIEVKPSR
ncbi:hypothetical protein MICAE_520011 [Microcystis aeruginosa PCC 9806]|uniref:Uncharacterized protein n=1 Tax=Microcystis aeruginosa PCC 9806 TaxID=1160282 RepID=I4GZL8_MICAE|nr:hypothetical protein MICAE_520011 [Microcystis aeruginosa PCC 9806]